MSSPTADKRRLTPELRAGLNLARAAAAIYVVVYHVAQQHLHGVLSAPFRFGQEAVIVFFLLSGFVIFANERERVHSEPGAYVLRRIRRIYPPMLISIALAALLYAVDDSYGGTFRVKDLVATLFSVQDINALKPGVIADPVFNNNPLWSLSYEMLFYLAFPLVMILWRRAPSITVHVVGVVSVLAYLTYVAAPNHWSLMVSYFLLWWAGAEMARAYLDHDFSLRAMLPTLGWMAVLVLASGAGVLADGSNGIGFYPLLMSRHFIFALFCAVLVLTPAAGLFGRLALRGGTPVTFAASISYGLYVFHYPLLLNWSFTDTVGGFIVALVLLITLAYLGDRWLDQRLPKPRSRGGQPTIPAGSRRA